MGHDTDGFSLNPENMLAMKPWTGNSDDKSLEDSIDFLEMLAFSRQSDLRNIIKKHQSDAFPNGFEAKQELIFEKTRNEYLESLKKRDNNFILRIFGLTSGNAADRNKDMMKSYSEKKNERIELRRKEWDRVKKLMQKQLEAEMEKEKAYIAEHGNSLWNIFGKSPLPSTQSSPTTDKQESTEHK